EITSRVGKDVLRMMIEKGGDPSVIIEEQGLKQSMDESAIEALAQKIIKENSKVAEDYKLGKETALQFLIGQGMKLTKGSVSPEMLAKKIKEIIIKS
ncbi:MAG: Asp-tRNA(Asn)/Glu-tRNA(Gln) amidotransferase GatCAB subunit B, partial [Candidatus Falkowbacteria bacterium]